MCLLSSSFCFFLYVWWKSFAPYPQWNKNSRHGHCLPKCGHWACRSAVTELVKVRSLSLPKCGFWTSQSTIKARSLPKCYSLWACRRVNCQLNKPYNIFSLRLPHEIRINISLGPWCLCEKPILCSVCLGRMLYATTITIIQSDFQN